MCSGVLFESPILQLNGMPRAAQYYPRKNEFSTDTGIELIIYQCSGCGLVQHNLQPVDYFREVITAATLSGKSRASRLEQMSSFVSRFNLKGKKVLEVGSARGEMLDVLQEVGLKPVGIETSKNSVAIGRAAQRTMVQAYIGEVEHVEGAPFDSFISLNFLEHLPKPGDIIRTIYAQTTSDAVGYVTVPNLDYLLRTKCLYEFVADHVSYFSKKTLARAFEINGFDVLDCYTINNENDIVAIVKKRPSLEIDDHYQDVESLIYKLRQIVDRYSAQNKKIAVWGAGHRTLALLALAKLHEISCIIDSAPFKQGKYTPILHKEIVSPDTIKERHIDLVMIMVPGLYPSEVLNTLDNMKLDVDIAILRDNKVEFLAQKMKEMV